MKSEKHSGKIWMIPAAGVLWGIIGIFSKNLAAEGCSPVEITFLRNCVAAVGMMLYLLLFRRSCLKIRLKDLPLFLGTGIVSIAFFNVMYFMTIEKSSLSLAAVLLYTAPCFVMVFSVMIFHEKLTIRKILALLAAFIGCAFTTGIVEELIGGRSGAVSRTAILTGLASGLGYSLYSIFGKVALRRYSTETVTAYTFLIAMLALTPFSLNRSMLTALRTPSVIGNTLAIGIVSTMLPFLLYTAGLKYTEAGKAAIMAFVEPLVATLTGVLYFRQKLSIYEIVGIVGIFASIVILESRRNAAHADAGQ